MERSVRVHVTSVAGWALGLGAVVGVSVVTSTVVASRAYERRGQQAVSQSRELTVRGSARHRVQSDQADWSLTVVSVGATLPEAYGEMEQADARVREYLAAGGLASREIEAEAIDVQPRYERNAKGELGNRIESYGLSRRLRISTKDVGKVASLAGEVTKLLKDNVLVESARPRYTYTGLAELRITLAGEAAQDARARADELAGKSGARIVVVRSVSSGPIQVTVPNSTDAQGQGSYDTGTIAKDVWMSVTANFGIDGK